MKKPNFQRKMVTFFLISELIFALNFYFLIYPFMGLSYKLIIKGMGPSFIFMMSLIITTTIVIGLISNKLEKIEPTLPEDKRRAGIEKTEKIIKRIFIYMNIIFFPIFIIIGGYITLLADGLLRWSTIRSLIVCGIILGPSLGLLQLIYLEYLLKDVKIYLHIIDYDTKRIFLKFSGSFLLTFFLIGLLVITFLAMVAITNVEKIAGISNVAVKINQNATVEQPDGYFSNLLNLALNSTDQNVKQEAEKLIKEWDATAFNYVKYTLLAMVLAMTLFLMYTAVVGINYSSHLKSIKTRLESIIKLEGDLTQMIVKTRDDEIGEIQTLFNKFILNLNNTFYKIFNTAQNLLNETNNRQKSVETLIRSNTEILKSNEEMSFELSNLTTISSQTSAVVKNFIETVNSNFDMINEQSAMIEESTASTTEMNASIQAVSKSTETAFKISEDLKLASKNTFNAIAEMQDIIKNINQNSEGIFEIVSTISSIAEQTDILAINASIEAAHAGEFGKGFSVVADEIRNLAENTSGRTKEISEMLNSMTEIIKKAVEKSNHATGAINNIQQCITSTIQIINEINSAAKEQLIGTNENLSAIQHLVKSSTQIMENLNIQKNMNKDLEAVSKKINDAMSIIDQVKKKQQIFFEELNNNFDQFQSFFYNTTKELNTLNVEFEKLKFIKKE